MRENLAEMSDEEIMASLEVLARSEREDLIRILKRLAELERRRAADRKGYPSLYAYCTRRLAYSEGEAMRRIQTARAAARFPVVYRLVGRGILTVTAIAYLEPHLTRENYHSLLKRSVGLTTKEVKALADALSPDKPPADRVRHFTAAPERKSSEVGPMEDLFIPAAPAEPAPEVRATPPEEAAPVRVHFSFSADEALLKGVERAKELLRHKHPFARLEDVFAEAMEALLEQIDPERRLARKATRERPSDESGSHARRVPQWVRDAVWRRDGGSCAYVGEAGRCGSRAFLEYDHLVPWALGGRSDDPANVRLLCRAHNQLEARRAFGDAAVDAASRGETEGAA